MHVLRRSKTLPYTAKELFDLVMDVESYPDFLPWCQAARVISKNEAQMIAEVVIGFKSFSENYESIITPKVQNDKLSIHVESTKGPFKHLINDWTFTTEGANSKVDFFIDFEFKSKLLNALIGGVFANATDKMIEAFEGRAQKLYR